MLQDLLTIRADRDLYYYGCDALFTRHPELIHRLCPLAEVPEVTTSDIPATNMEVENHLFVVDKSSFWGHSEFTHFHVGSRECIPVSPLLYL